MFFEGSIERAKSITQGGAKNAIATIGTIGITTLVDSLTVIKQHIFDEKTFTIEQLHDALVNNWQGYEQMRSHIIKTTKFFGNNYEISDTIAARVANSMTEHFAPKRSNYGYHFLLGNLIGYNQHNKFFGELLMATPDGRYKGDAISFGIGQTDGKDREGLSSLLISVAKLNQNLILCGATVTNILLEEQLIKNDANFEKLVKLFEAYFKLGGLHFQLNYISRQDLINAKADPEKYRSLRVRVSGFSDYFRLLNEDLQDDIIRRTEVKG
jgi:formate C-acetyltransferase